MEDAKATPDIMLIIDDFKLSSSLRIGMLFKFIEKKILLEF